MTCQGEGFVVDSLPNVPDNLEAILGGKKIMIKDLSFWICSAGLKELDFVKEIP